MINVSFQISGENRSFINSVCATGYLSITINKESWIQISHLIKEIPDGSQILNIKM